MLSKECNVVIYLRFKLMKVPWKNTKEDEEKFLENSNGSRG